MNLNAFRFANYQQRVLEPNKNCSADVGSKSTKVGMILTTQEIFIVLYNCLENCNLGEPECFQVRGEHDRQQQGGMKRLGQERDWGVRGEWGNAICEELFIISTLKGVNHQITRKYTAQ